MSSLHRDACLALTNIISNNITITTSTTTSNPTISFISTCNTYTIQVTNTISY